MIRKLPALLLLAAAFLPAACATSTSAPTGSVASAAYADEARVWSDLARLEFSKRPHVELPARMVVVDEARSNWRHGHAQAEAQRLDTVVRRLRKERDALSYVSPIFGADVRRAQTENGEDWRRMAAAQHQADLMLVTQWTESVRGEGSVLQVLDLLILPAFLFPTHGNRLEVTLESAVIDVRNGLVYASTLSTARAETSSTRVGEDTDVRDELDALHAEQVEDLVDQLRDRLTQVQSAR